MAGSPDRGAYLFKQRYGVRIAQSCPTRAEIIADLNTTEKNLIVEVDAAVARKTASIPALGFSNKFKSAAILGSLRYSLVIH